MGKQKVVAEAPDPELSLSISFERSEATFVAGEVVIGTIECSAAHPFDCEDIALTLIAKERATGVKRQPFQWEVTLLEQKIELDRGQGESFSAGSHSISFRVELETTLEPTYTFESPSFGTRSRLKIDRFYSVAAVVSLRNSTKVETTAGIVVKRCTDVVWSGSLPSTSIEDIVSQPVGSPLSKCLCWRRGETSVSATIHNRTVDIAAGVAHVRGFVVNRSALNVNAARLCLLVDMALHGAKNDAGNDEVDNEPDHVVELLTATDYRPLFIPPNCSAHFNLELDVKRVALSLLFDQETVLEPSIRTRYLEVGYVIRVEVCHSTGGSTVSVDLPLVLVPLPSDILPPLETQPLTPIRGGESQASTEHDEDEDEVALKNEAENLHISSPQTRPVEAVSATSIPLFGDDETEGGGSMQEAPETTAVFQHDIRIDIP